MPNYFDPKCSTLRLSTDGILIEESKATTTVKRVYTLKNNTLNEITWINIRKSYEFLLKMITTELVRIFLITNFEIKSLIEPMNIGPD